MSVATATYAVQPKKSILLLAIHREDSTSSKPSSTQEPITTAKIKRLLEDQQQTAFKNFTPELKAFFVQNQQASSHLSQIISRQPLEVDEKIRQWLAFSIFSMLMRNKLLVNTMSSNAFEALTLKDGICVGMVCQHILKQLEATAPASIKNSCLALKEPMVCKSLTSHAYPFNMTSEESLKQTSQARFLQAAYDIGQQKDSPGFFLLPKHILQKYHLKISKTNPQEKDSYPMDALVEKLSNLKSPPSTEKKEYLLAIGAQHGHHAIQFQASAPYHFMDPAFGVVEFDTFENLVTGLTCYVHYTYNTDTHFAITEFSELKP